MLSARRVEVLQATHSSVLDVPARLVVSLGCESTPINKEEGLSHLISKSGELIPQAPLQLVSLLDVEGEAFSLLPCHQQSYLVLCLD